MPTKILWAIRHFLLPKDTFFYCHLHSFFPSFFHISSILLYLLLLALYFSLQNIMYRFQWEIRLISLQWALCLFFYIIWSYMPLLFLQFVLIPSFADILLNIKFVVTPDRRGSSIFKSQRLCNQGAASNKGTGFLDLPGDLEAIR